MGKQRKKRKTEKMREQKIERRKNRKKNKKKERKRRNLCLCTERKNSSNDHFFPYRRWNHRHFATNTINTTARLASPSSSSSSSFFFFFFTSPPASSTVYVNNGEPLFLDQTSVGPDQNVWASSL